MPPESGFNMNNHLDEGVDAEHSESFAEGGVETHFQYSFHYSGEARAFAQQKFVFTNKKFLV